MDCLINIAQAYTLLNFCLLKVKFAEDLEA